MAAKAHVILSASSSDRWLHCPPSARLCKTYEDKGSDYAAEGTDAHALGEHKLKTALGLPSEDPNDSLKWYSEEMEDCTSGYAEYVLEQIEAAKETCADPVVLIEQRVDFSRWVEQGFGTADCVIIADGTLRVIDYKHGLGVLVSAEENPQMQCYALGALELFDDIYDIEQVSMTIYQPRRQNVGTYEISKDDLYRWADEVLKPTAELAFAGDGNFLCGEWCGFCKAKNEYRARAEANLKLAQHDFKLPPLLTNTEIEVILNKVDELVSWASDIKEYALQQALSGKEWTGFKIVEGRSNRRYSNEAAVIDTVEKAGFDPYEKKLLGITAMQKLLGKSRFDELNARCNLTELPNDQFIPAPRIKVRYMALELRISNIGKVSDSDIRILNCGFYIDFFIITCNRMDRIWIRCFPKFHLISSSDIYLTVTTTPTSNSATQHSDIYRGNSTLTLFEPFCP